MGTVTEELSYHDLHVTTADIPRTSIANLAYGYEVWCNRVVGWSFGTEEKSIATEYGYKDWLILDVAGHVIVDSKKRKEEDEQEDADKMQTDAEAMLSMLEDWCPTDWLDSPQYAEWRKRYGKGE